MRPQLPIWISIGSMPPSPQFPNFKAILGNRLGMYRTLIEIVSESHIEFVGHVLGTCRKIEGILYYMLMEYELILYQMINSLSDLYEDWTAILRHDKEHGTQINNGDNDDEYCHPKKPAINVEHGEM